MVALDVLQWKTEGKPIKEIRKMIEDKYTGRYGQPTPTPPVE